MTPRQKTTRQANRARRVVYIRLRYLRKLERLAEHWASCQVLTAIVKTPAARARALQAERKLMDLLWERRAERKKKKKAG